MSVKPMDVFPDLHHKMSKKIAQLTKVIYHLNTRNEDHQADMDAMQHSHQAEIQQILKDAASRINKFKEAVESKQSQVNADHKLRQLQQKYEMEREAAAQEFNRYQENSHLREGRISHEFQEKYDIVRGQVEAMNKRFLEKVRDFEATNKQLADELKDEKISSGERLNAERKNHAKELAELVRTSNEKYQNMLVDQMKCQEDLRSEADKMVNKAKEDITAALTTDHEQAMGQQRAKLIADKEAMLMATRHEHEDALKVQRADLMAKLDHALGDLEKRTKDYSAKVSVQDAIEAELRAQLDALRGDTASASRAMDEKIRLLEAEVARQNESHATLSTQLDARKADIAQRDQQLIELRGDIDRLTSLLSEKEAHIRSLRDDISKAGANEAEKVEALMKQLLSADREMDAMRRENSSLNASITTLKTDMARERSDAERALASAQKEVKHLQNEVADLLQRLDNTQSASKGDKDRLSSELERIRGQMMDMQTSHRAELDERSAQHGRAMVEARERHCTELEGSNKIRQELLDTAKRREVEVAEDKAKMIQLHAANMAQLREEQELAIATLQEQHIEEIEKLKSKITLLEAQLNDLSSQADGEKGSMKNEISRLDAKAKALQKDLDIKKKEAERVEGVCNGLKNQVESLREELKASQKAFRDKMDLSLAKLDAEWTEKFDKLRAEQELRLAEAIANRDRNHITEIEAVMAAHADEVAALKSALQKEATDASSALSGVEIERARLEAELSEEKTFHKRSVEEGKMNKAQALAELDDRRLKELDALRRELSGTAESRETDLLDRHAAELEALRASHADEIASLTAEAVAQKEAAHEEAEGILKRSLAELRAQADGEKAAAIASLETTHAGLIETLKEENSRAVGMLNQEIEGLKRSLSLSQQEVVSIEEQLARERMEKARREERVVLDRDKLIREHDTDLRKEKERSERALLDLQERALREIKEVKQVSQNEKNGLLAKIKDLESDLEVMQVRFRNRESRPGDLDRIRELEEEMVEKDVLVEQTKKEMLYFKREMLNREESYNQKFNATPNVGVMNVLKSKDPSSVNGSVPGSRKTGVPPGGAGPALGVGGGGGLGIGGISSNASAQRKSNRK